MIPSAKSFTVQVGPRVPGDRLRNGDCDGGYYVKVGYPKVAWFGPYQTITDANTIAREILETIEYGFAGAVPDDTPTGPTGVNYTLYNQVEVGKRYWLEASRKWYVRPEAGGRNASGYLTSVFNDDKDPPVPVYGCTDSTARNYDNAADTDDGSCQYYIDGCTDSTARNYDPYATRDDNTCQYYIRGCTNPSATNYNIKANKDDGSCVFAIPVFNPNPVGPMIIGGVIYRDPANKNLFLERLGYNQGTPLYLSYDPVTGHNIAGYNNPNYGFQGTTVDIYAQTAFTGNMYWIDPQLNYGTFDATDLTIGLDPVIYIAAPKPESSATPGGPINVEFASVTCVSANVYAERYTPIYDYANVPTVVRHDVEVDTPNLNGGSDIVRKTAATLTSVVTKYIAGYSHRKVLLGTANPAYLTSQKVEYGYYTTLDIGLIRGTVFTGPAKLADETDRISWIDLEFDAVAVYLDREPQPNRLIPDDTLYYYKAVSEPTRISITVMSEPSHGHFQADPSFRLGGIAVADTPTYDPKSGKPLYKAVQVTGGHSIYAGVDTLNNSLISYNDNGACRVEVFYQYMFKYPYVAYGDPPAPLQGGGTVTNYDTDQHIPATFNTFTSGLGAQWIVEQLYGGDTAYGANENGASGAYNPVSDIPLTLLRASATQLPPDPNTGTWNYSYPTWYWYGTARRILAAFEGDSTLDYARIDDNYSYGWRLSGYGTVGPDGIGRVGNPPPPPMKSIPPLPPKKVTLFGGTATLWIVGPGDTDNADMYDNNAVPIDPTQGSRYYRFALDDGRIAYYGVGEQNNYSIPTYDIATKKPQLTYTDYDVGTIPAGKAIVGCKDFLEVAPRTDADHAQKIMLGQYYATPTKVYVNSDNNLLLVNAVLAPENIPIIYTNKHPDPTQVFIVGATNGKETHKLGSVRILLNGGNDQLVTFYTEPQFKLGAV